MQLLQVVEPVHVDVHEREGASYSRTTVNVGLTTGSVMPSATARPLANTVLPGAELAVEHDDVTGAQHRADPPTERVGLVRARASTVCSFIASLVARCERALDRHEVGARLRERGTTAAQHRRRVQRGDEHRAVADRGTPDRAAW